jgi:ribosomal protein S6--L-glutamate ligase
MRRRARHGEFRSNLHRGGEGEPVEPVPAYARAAERAAQLLGLEVAGVDLLEGAHGPRVVEVNSTPGFQGLERATGLDIAGLVVEHAARRAGGAPGPDSADPGAPPRRVTPAGPG